MLQPYSPLILHMIAAYALEGDPLSVVPLGTGLINQTWKITTPRGVFVLQKINPDVFHDPEAIARNIDLIAAWLKEHHPDYYLPTPIAASNGHSLQFLKEEGYFRLFPFVKGSVTKEVVETPDQAYEAALQFGRFTRLLSGLDIHCLQNTIPSFHDLSLRYNQFTHALTTGNSERIKTAQELIRKMIAWSYIAAEYEKIRHDPAFRLRATHHDTKISNVLFDSNDKGLCVIDLDTVMPGYFISDLGDMMRTYLSPVSEDEADLSKIVIREEFYQALVQGYHDEMKDELSDSEKGAFFFSGLFMIYMQAIRFLTDYLQNDVYYGEKYPGHNLVRAANQACLLEKLLGKKVLFTLQ